ncbi:hypothetical protein CYMTET_12739 [Cymbomonas tetramitiformis]|uniref:Uncharacterized protein n=1 Tax=Cymbomonas tetramitiformis TaxID=36881 RepID=A0AAE0LBJ0_9CHLO|nr:hypothetical protein CYMTET_12739 [Cymbomonas tetramitiformis]
MLVRGARTLSSHLKGRMCIYFGGVQVPTRTSACWFEDFRDRGRLTLELSSSDGNRLYLLEGGHAAIRNAWALPTD